MVAFPDVLGLPNVAAFNCKRQRDRAQRGERRHLSAAMPCWAAFGTSRPESRGGKGHAVADAPRRQSGASPGPGASATVGQATMSNFDEFVKRLRLERLGDYEYRRHLGQGGQGTVCVYAKKDGPEVAVKFLIAPRSDEEVHRFRAEVVALKKCVRLFDPATVIAALSDAQQVADLPVFYFIMELGTGQSLASLIKQRPPPWPWRDALAMTARIAWALSSASAAGLVHRDLHPGNILVDDTKLSFGKNSVDGHPGILLLDFGVHFDAWTVLSKGYEGANEDSAHTFRPVGSVRYLSPEALNDPSSVDVKSDAWSIGTILYQLLFGRFPFESATLVQLAKDKGRGLGVIPNIDNADVKLTKLLSAMLHGTLCADRTRRYSASDVRRVAYDVTEYDLLSTFPGDLDQYIANKGDVMMCLTCRQVGACFGSRCEGCGQPGDERLHWSAAV